MPDALPAQEIDERREALEHSFVSTLETITNLPYEKVVELSEDLAEKTLRTEKRHRHQQPDITFIPKNPRRIEFKVQIKNTTRSPQEILEDYLEKRDKSTDNWRVREEGSGLGSLKTFVATRGTGGSSSSSKDEVDELQEKLEGLDDKQKQAVKEVLG